MNNYSNNVAKWIATARFLKGIRKVAENAVFYAISNNNGEVIFYNNNPNKLKVIRLIKKIQSENEMVLSFGEGCQIFSAVQKTNKVKGDIAEVGVYRGGSAKLICEAKSEKTLYLFDTFEGLPKLHRKDSPEQFYEGQYPATFEQVSDYLKKYPRVKFYKGLFPSTAGPIRNKNFSFVHLDVDLYRPTFDSLEFFYPRMSAGGIIISHDYGNAKGVRKAVDEFFKDKPELIIECSGSQCLIIKD